MPFSNIKQDTRKAIRKNMTAVSGPAADEHHVATHTTPSIPGGWEGEIGSNRKKPCGLRTQRMNKQMEQQQ